MSGRGVLIKNIYHMLAYAFKSLRQSGYEDAAAEDFEYIHDLFAAILAEGIGRQLKQGLYREYAVKREELPVMRGRIDMQGTVKKRLERKNLLVCEYGELSEDNILNRILKTTAMLLLKSADVKPAYRDALKREMLYFSDVGEIDLRTVKWQSLRFDRGCGDYRMLIGICRLVAEGLLITTEKGGYRLASFIDEQPMCRLYEKFILEYYARNFPQLSVSAPRIPWSLEDGADSLLPVMQSDIHLQKGGTALIIDAKYYSRTTCERFGKKTLHSNNLYQIFTYVKNRDYSFGAEEHTVSGMLLYAKTDEELCPDSVYQMHGNKISVKTLDLNREFPLITCQLDEIARQHFK